MIGQMSLNQFILAKAFLIEFPGFILAYYCLFKELSIPWQDF